jgi:hypothetical protein
MKTEIEVGDVVKVGPKFEMGDRLGQGRMVADDYTGRVFRVVALRTGKLGPSSAALAPANIIGADESDEVVDVVLRRLSLA